MRPPRPLRQQLAVLQRLVTAARADMHKFLGYVVGTYASLQQPRQSGVRNFKKGSPILRKTVANVTDIWWAKRA